MQTMREYETLYILNPDIAEDAMAQVNDRLKEILDRQGAKVLRCAVWGKKKLAFEVQKNPKGVYVQMTYLGEPTVIQEFERNLRLIEPVVRYQTIKLAENVDVEKRLAEQAAEDRQRAEQEARLKAEQEARAAERAALEEQQAKAEEAAAAAEQTADEAQPKDQPAKEEE